MHEKFRVASLSMACTRKLGAGVSLRESVRRDDLELTLEETAFPINSSSWAARFEFICDAVRRRPTKQLHVTWPPQLTRRLTQRSDASRVSIRRVTHAHEHSINRAHSSAGVPCRDVCQAGDRLSQFPTFYRPGTLSRFSGLVEQ